MTITLFTPSFSFFTSFQELHLRICLMTTNTTSKRILAVKPKSSKRFILGLFKIPLSFFRVEKYNNFII